MFLTSTYFADSIVVYGVTWELSKILRDETGLPKRSRDLF
jgi:hypothetical protein